MAVPDMSLEDDCRSVTATGQSDVQSRFARTQPHTSHADTELFRRVTAPAGWALWRQPIAATAALSGGLTRGHQRDSRTVRQLLAAPPTLGGQGLVKRHRRRREADCNEVRTVSRGYGSAAPEIEVGVVDVPEVDRGSRRSDARIGRRRPRCRVWTPRHGYDRDRHLRLRPRG